MAGKKERISIACNIGWHVTSPEKALMMLNGVQPISKGLVEFGEEKANKTYFFRNKNLAFYYIFCQLEDSGIIKNEKIKFISNNPFDYEVVILEFNLTGLVLFEDQEARTSCGFTISYIPSNKIRVIQVYEWMPKVKELIKKYKA